MKRQRFDSAFMAGLLILGAVLCLFLLVTSCQPDFFRNVAPIP